MLWYIWCIFHLCLFLCGKDAMSPRACFTTATSLESKKHLDQQLQKNAAEHQATACNLFFSSLNKVHPTNLVPSFEIVLFWYVCYLCNERGEFERSSRTTFAVNLCNTERLLGLVTLNLKILITQKQQYMVFFWIYHWDKYMNTQLCVLIPSF